MTFEDALSYVKMILQSKNNKKLTSSEEAILKAAWESETYNSVANDLHLSLGHIKDLASSLWKRLSEAFNKKTTKNNFRYLMETGVVVLSSDLRSKSHIHLNHSETSESIILVSEDIIENLNFLAEALANKGHSFNKCFNRRIAVKILYNNSDDTILLNFEISNISDNQSYLTLEADK